MHRFGVLVPSTNTTVETEYGRLLPVSLQVHVARIPLLSSGVETPPRSGDADVDHQARMLGDAGVEVVALMQTAASLLADNYDDRITKRMSDAAGFPAITSARAIGLAIRSLGARRMALVAPFPMAVKLSRAFPSPAPTPLSIRRSRRAWPAMRSCEPIGRTLKYSLSPEAIFQQ
jgi:maleate cis-trans isomerase